MIMDIVGGDNSLKNPAITVPTTPTSSNTANKSSRIDANDPNKMDVQEKSPEMFCSLLEMMKMFSLDDIAQKLCLMSQIPMLCEEMRNYGYLPMLVRLLHQHSVDDNELDAKELLKTNKTRRDLAQALSNIVMNTSKCEKEIKILKILEDLKAFTETLCMRSMAGNGGAQESSSSNDGDNDYNSVDHPCSILMDLCKMCNEPQSIEMIELFGGVYVISEVIKFDYKCHPKSKNEDCFKIRLFSLMIITHLTYNNPQVKSMLGAKRSFIQTLIDLLQETKYNNNEDMMQTIANVIQNLSWDSNYLSMQTMRDCQCVTHLTKALLVAKRDSTLKCLLAALGNLTASSPPNKADFCKTNGGLKFLISILELNRQTTNTTTAANDGPPTAATGVDAPTAAPGAAAAATTKMKSQHQSMAIVEAGGCILRNISSYLANEERYRKILRENKTIPLLLEHLESPSLNVVANACVILSNLSATITTNVIDEESSSSPSASSLDQIEMIEMNAVKKLANLKNSRHKIIKEGAIAAYKHLVTSQAYMLYSSFNEEQQQNKLSTSMSFSSFPMRKFKALKDEISNLSDMGAMSASACTSVRLSQPKSPANRQLSTSGMAKSSPKVMNEKFSRFSRSTSDTFATYHFQNTNGNPLPMSESMVASIPGSKGGNSVHNCDNDSPVGGGGGGGGVSSEYDIYSGDAKCQIINSNNANSGKQPMPSSSASSSSFLEDGEIDEDYTTDFSERYKEQNLEEFRMPPETTAARRSSISKSNPSVRNDHDSNANNSGNVKDCGGKNINEKLMKNDRKTSISGSGNDTGNTDNNDTNQDDDNNENSQTNHQANADHGGEDSVKIYQTEGTPLMFSLVSSLLDLSEIDLKCINEEDEGKQQQQQQQQPSSPPSSSLTHQRPGPNNNSEPPPPSTNKGQHNTTQPHKISSTSQNEKKSTMFDSSKPLLPPKPDGSPNNSGKNNDNKNTSDNLQANPNDRMIQDEMKNNADKFQKDLGRCDGQPQSDGIVVMNQNVDDDNGGHKGLNNTNDEDDNIGVSGDASADSALKFETENTPAIFSHATSLSSLTVDDEDDENPCDQADNDTSGSNVVTAKAKKDIGGELSNNPTDPTIDPDNVVNQQMKTTIATITATTAKIMMTTSASASPTINKTPANNKQPPPPPPKRLEQRLDPIGSETNRSSSNRLQSLPSSLAKSAFGKQMMFKQNNVVAQRQQQQQQQPRNYSTGSDNNNRNRNRPDQSQQPRSHVMVVGVCPKKLPIVNSESSDDDDKILQQCIECALPTYSSLKRSQPTKPKQQRSGMVPKSGAVAHAHNAKTTAAPPPPPQPLPVKSAMPVVGQFSEHHSSLSSLSFDSDTGIGTSSGATVTTTGNNNNNNKNSNAAAPIIANDSDIDDLDEVEDNQLLAAAINLGINCNITSPVNTMAKNAGGSGGGGGGKKAEGRSGGGGSSSDSASKTKQQPRNNSAMVTMVTNTTDNNNEMNGNQTMNVVETVAVGGDGSRQSKNMMDDHRQDSINDDDDEKTYTICFQGPEYSGNESQQQQQQQQQPMQPQTNVVRSPRKPRLQPAGGSDAASTVTKTSTPTTTTTKVTSKSIPIPSARTTILNSNNNSSNKSRNQTATNMNEKNINRKYNPDDVSQEDRTLLASRKDNRDGDDHDQHDQQQQQQQLMQNSFINLENTKPPSIMEHCHSLMSHSSSSIDSEISDIAFDQIPIRKISSNNNDDLVAAAASNCAKEINTLVQSFMSEHAAGSTGVGVGGDTSGSVKDSTSSSLSIEMNAGLPPSGYSAHHHNHHHQQHRTGRNTGGNGKRNHGSSSRKASNVQDDRTFEIIPKGGGGKQQSATGATATAATATATAEAATADRWSINEQQTQVLSRRPTGISGSGSTDTRTYNKNDLERKQFSGSSGMGGNIPIGYNYYESDQSDTDISEILPLDDMDGDDGPPTSNHQVAIVAAASASLKFVSSRSPPDSAATVGKPPLQHQQKFLYNKPHNIEAQAGGVNNNNYTSAAAIKSSPKIAQTARQQQREQWTAVESGGAAAHHGGGGSGKKVYPASSSHQRKHSNSNSNNNRKDSLHYSCGHQLDRLEDMESETRYYRPSSQNSRPIPQPRSASSSSRQHHYHQQQQQQQHQLVLSFNPFGSSANSGGGGGFDPKLNFNQISRSLTRGHKFMNSQADFEDKDLMFTSKHRDKVDANHVLYFQNKSNQSSGNNNCKTTTKYFDRLTSPMMVAKSGGRSNADALIDDFDTDDDDGEYDYDDDDEDEDGDDLMEELMDNKNQRMNDQASLARMAAVPPIGKNGSPTTKQAAPTKRKEKSLLSKLTKPFTSSSSSLSSNQQVASLQATANAQPDVAGVQTSDKKPPIKTKGKKSDTKSRFGLPWRRSKSTHDDLRIVESGLPPSTTIQQTSQNIAEHSANVGKHPNVVQQQQQQQSSSSPPMPGNQRVQHSPSLINRLIPSRRSLANHEMMANLSRNLTRSATFDTFAGENKKSQTIQSAQKQPKQSSANDGNFRFTTFVRSAPANDNNNNATNTTNTNSPDQADPGSKPKQQQQQQHRSSLTKMTRKSGQKKPSATGLVDANANANGNGNGNSNGGKNPTTDNVAANRKTCLVTTV